MDRFTTVMAELLRAPIDPTLRFALYYIAPTILLAFLIWLARGRPQPFLAWLLPRAVYTHRSNLVDIKLFLSNHILGVVGVFGAVVFTPLVAFHVLGTIAGLAGGDFALPPITAARALLLTFIVVVVNDFSKYWTHRIHHEWPSL